MAVQPETLIGSSIGAGAAQSGLGLRHSIYSTTKVAAGDGVEFTDFTQVVRCLAVNDAAGALDPVVSIVGNVVTFSVGTGSVTLYTWGY